MDNKLDVSASYPNGGSALNVAKETTRTELPQIKGIPEQMQRMQGINFTTSGPTNCIEVGHTLAGMPTHTQMLEAFRKHRASQHVST